MLEHLRDKLIPSKVLMLTVHEDEGLLKKAIRAGASGYLVKRAAALQEFAGLLGACAREVDTVARLGGDEFAVILYESDAEGAQAFSDRVIQQFRRHGLPDAAGNRTERLSVSIGVASFPSDSFDRSDLLKKADRALYLAKERGGGRVCLYYETGETGNGKSSPQELPVRKLFDASRSVVDMDRFLEILLFTGMQGLGAARGSIVVRDPAGEFSLRAAIGFHPSRIGSSFTGRLSSVATARTRCCAPTFQTSLECGIPKEIMAPYFRPMWDYLSITRFPTFADLVFYMEGSAIPVGRAMTHILGVRPPFRISDAIPGADSLSIAMQLSNFWRDIGNDWGIRRVYIPLEDLDRFNYTVADLAARRITPAFIELLEYEFERTEGYYRQARSSVSMLASGRWAVMSGLEEYRSIIAGIRH